MTDSILIPAMACQPRNFYHRPPANNSCPSYKVWPCNVPKDISDYHGWLAYGPLCWHTCAVMVMAVAAAKAAGSFFVPKPPTSRVKPWLQFDLFRESEASASVGFVPSHAQSFRGCYVELVRTLWQMDLPLAVGRAPLNARLAFHCVPRRRDLLKVLMAAALRSVQSLGGRGLAICSTSWWPRPRDLFKVVAAASRSVESRGRGLAIRRKSVASVSRSRVSHRSSASQNQ
jgi:hypothetical protein